MDVSQVSMNESKAEKKKKKKKQKIDEEAPEEATEQPAADDETVRFYKINHKYFFFIYTFYQTGI